MKTKMENPLAEFLKTPLKDMYEERLKQSIHKQAERLVSQIETCIQNHAVSNKNCPAYTNIMWEHFIYDDNLRLLNNMGARMFSYSYSWSYLKDNTHKTHNNGYIVVWNKEDAEAFEERVLKPQLKKVAESDPGKRVLNYDYTELVLGI